MVFKPKIIIVDDNEIFRHSLEFHLSITLNYDVIGIAANGEEFLALKNIHNADVILMDIEMPVLNGFGAARKAIWTHINLNIIAITNYQDKAYLKDLIETGFKGCVFKRNLFNEIELAIKDVLNNTMYFPENIELNSL